MNETERTFEEFIEAYLTSEAGGWQGTTDAGYCDADRLRQKHTADGMEAF